MSIVSQAARRYGHAFIEAAGDNLAACVEELSKFSESVESVPEFRHVLLNPSFTAAEENQALEAVMEHLGLSDVVRRFIRLVASRERMPEIGDITSEVKRLSDERANRVEALVEVASEAVSDDTLARLKTAIEKRTGKSVELSVSVDPSLIGGIRTTVGSIVFDGTIRTELERLRETLAATD